MPYQLNKKLAGLEPYQPIAGNYPIRLDAKESFIPLPPDIAGQVAEQLANVQVNRYPDPSAAGVCGAFADYYGVQPLMVTAANGSDEMIQILISSFLQKGDKLLTFTPDFAMYPFYAYLSEVQNRAIAKNAGLEINVDEAIAAIRKERPHMVLFSNPCNPTSLGISAKEVLRLVAATDALVVVDEAYMDFWDQSVLTQVPKTDNLIVLKTASKMGFAAWRLGFAVANEHLTAAIRAAKSPYNVNALTQAAGRVIYQNGDFLRQCAAQIKASREQLCEALREAGPDIKVYQSRTNFVFVKTDRAAAIFEGLKTRGIIVRHFEGHLQITAGTEAENKAFLSAFGDLL